MKFAIISCRGVRYRHSPCFSYYCFCSETQATTLTGIIQASAHLILYLIPAEKIENHAYMPWSLKIKMGSQTF